MAEQIHQGSLHSFFQRYVQSWGGDTGLLKGFLMEDDPGILLKDLGEEYERLFSGLSDEGISLVESFYKPWTLDPHCTLPFASERGLLMGDSALHLLEIYRQCGLEVAEEFKGCSGSPCAGTGILVLSLPDGRPILKLRQFIEDHLDWIPLFKEEI